MPDTIENFRTSLHGFNRADVVRFIQAQTAEHENDLRQLREENERLQSELSEARASAAQAIAEKTALACELEALKAMPQPEPPAAPAAPVPVEEPVVLQAPPAAPELPPVNFDEKELAAYRRAELTERLARERAVAAAERMRAIYARANQQLVQTSDDFATMLDTFQMDFEKFDQLLTSAMNAVSDASNDLKAGEDLASML